MNTFELEPTPQAWAHALKQLLDEAQTAAGGTDAERDRTIAALTEFVAAVPLTMPELGRIARQAADDLIDKNVATTLARLTERTTTLSKHIAALSQDSRARRTSGST